MSALSSWPGEDRMCGRGKTIHVPVPFPWKTLRQMGYLLAVLEEGLSLCTPNPHTCDPEIPSGPHPWLAEGLGGGP